MPRKRRRKHVEAGLGSRLALKYKVIIIFVLIFLSGAVMAYGSWSIVHSFIDESREESQNMILTASDEFLNTEIENIVSVSKTVYTNDEVYAFLNRRYISSVEYYDAYYDFSKSRFLVTTETSAIKEFRIYTGNSSVTSGGNIGKLNQIEDEDWYRRFRELDRDMIVYCSPEGRNLSLIRKLDYKKVNTGEAVLKIDFNPSKLQKSFKDMYFNGKVYLAHDGVLLYSNQKDASLPDEHILKDYVKKSRNFYTCDVDFYVLADSRTVISVFKIPFAVPLMFALAVFLFVIVALISDFQNRTMEVCRLCNDKRKISLDRNKVNMGGDEIATLYKDVYNTLIDLKRLADEKNNLRKFINEYKIKTNSVIISSLNFETRMKYGIETLDEVSTPVSLDEELRIMSRMLDRHRETEYFKYSLLSDTTSKVKNVIPYSLSAVALHVAQYGGTGGDVEIDVRELDGCYSIRYYKAGTALTSADVLRLRAIFEPESAKSLPSFEAEDEFNAYVRLSRFYLDNITLNINSKETLDFEFIITGQTE